MAKGIVIVVDRLRASQLSPYGNTWIEMPSLNQLVSESVLLENMIVDSLDVSRVYDSYFSGIHSIQQCERVDLIGELKGQGVSCRLLTDSPELAQHGQVDQFASVRLAEPPVVSAAAESMEDTTLAQFFAAAVEELKTIDSDCLLWLHTEALQKCWDAPLSYRRSFVAEDEPQPSDSVDVPNQVLPDDHDPDELQKFVATYSGQILLLDECLSVFLDELRIAGHLDDSLLIVTAPRGISLGEHGRVGDAEPRCFTEQTHVPFIIRYPDQRFATFRHPALVQPQDVCAILRHWYSQDSADESFPFWSLLNDHSETHQSLAITRSAGNGETHWALRTPVWNYCVSESELDTSVRLFLKPDDRWDFNDVTRRCPQVAQEFEAVKAKLATANDRSKVSDLLPLASELLVAPE